MSYFGIHCKKVRQNEIVIFKCRESEIKPFINNEIVIVSIDPGTINYAIRIESIKKEKIEMLVYKKRNLPKEENLKMYALNQFLDEFKEYYKRIHYVLIEKQMVFNHKANRIGHHTVSYFINICKNLPNYPRVIEFDSKLKTRVLSDEKIPGKKTKKWSIEFCKNELEKRNDLISLEILKKSRKKDDLADVVSQICSFLKIMNINQENLNTWIEPDF